MRTHERNDTEYWLQAVEESEFTKVKSSRRIMTHGRPNLPQEELAEDLYREEENLRFTYHAARGEQVWLSRALREFFADSVISDVLAMVKGGKEANVYCCQAHPNLGKGLLAAKVYRPSELRNLKNDAVYKEGRPWLAEDGKAIQDHRALRAIHKKTDIGQEMSITSWIQHEYQTLQVLHRAGAVVPEPVAFSEHAILMDYIGEAGLPAPTLHMVTLEPDEVKPLLRSILENVELFLAQNRIHADLSAYNVLYWEGQATIIDFPQVVDPFGNPSAFRFLARDVERICQYFRRYGLHLDASLIARQMWRGYLDGESGGDVAGVE